MNNVKQLINFYNNRKQITEVASKKHIDKLTTLSNSDLISICIKLKIKLVGVYMKDELQNSDLKQGCYIINLQNHDENGSHWTAFIKDKNDIYYYDSFGVVPPQNLYDIFIIDSTSLYYNTSDDQNFDSTSCGWWSIAFLYYMTNSKGSMLDRMKKFDKKFRKKDTKLNEIDLKKYISKIYLNKK
jgi:hypothetical protein